MNPSEALRQYFAFPAFRPGQDTAIDHVLNGRDTLVVMPTGSGKSLIYQLAALLLPGTTLVISPLVSLMKDQVDSLTRRSIPATFINSSLPPGEQSRRLRTVTDGQCKIVLVAPERLRSAAFRAALARISVSLLAIDEAHCLSQWGHDFRPDYLRLADARRELLARPGSMGRPVVTLALTATATPRVQDDVIRLLGLSQAQTVITGFNRPNLTFEVLSAPSPKAKLKLVRDFLAQAEGAGIIYTGTRRDAEEVAEFVRSACGLKAQHYHGALDAATRAATQDAFMAGDLPVVVATNAFGMGIDRPDVRFVLHYTLPSTLEAYYQEAGRAGRDELPARVVLLYSPRDTALHEFFIENDSPAAGELRAVHSFLARAGAGSSVSLEELENATGLPQTKARVALEQLEAIGAIQRAPDQAYGRIWVEAKALPEAALQAVAAQVAARRDHKRDQLDRMVDYAETNDCRRATLLKHFGDSNPADAPICCDNCLARAQAATTETRPAQTQSERAALIVLDTLAHLTWEIGKGKLAQLLKGSASKEMTAYARLRNFGKFDALSLVQIEALIGQLLDAGYIKQVGGDRPTLVLTSRGESALQARTAIQVDLRPVRREAILQVRAQKEAGGTVALTGQMLGRGLNPRQIAAERGLSEGTIYSHLAQLIAEGQADVSAVITPEMQQPIRAAITQVGSVSFLAPIKALLPAETDYAVIRCVVEAWRREQNIPAPAPAAINPSPPNEPAPSALVDIPFEPLRRWRRQHAASLGQPDYMVFGDDTLRRIAQNRPKTKAELRVLPRFGVELIDTFGDEIIALLVSEASTRVIDAIFECVSSLPGGLPRSGVAKVLVGSASERVEQYAAHPLYNRLTDHSRIDVTMQVDALLAAGYLAQDRNGRLIPQAAPGSNVRPAVVPAAPHDPALFERLRAWRLEKAHAMNKPPFVVFSDETLRGIAIAQPRSAEDLLAIRGIGAAKAEAYGAEILALLAEF